MTSDDKQDESGKEDITRLSSKPSEAYTRISQPAKSAEEANDRTVISQGRGTPPPTVVKPAKVQTSSTVDQPADQQDDKTRISAPAKPVTASEDNQEAPPEDLSTEYTQYRLTSNVGNSTGFKKAQVIAKKVLATKGNILKKRFVLEETLGEGGMGVVYKARDLRKVEAEDPFPFVAAKVLGQNFKDHPDAFVTLQQEAAKSQRLAHPNIVTVYDFDRDGDTIYITMELLKGNPLDAVLKEKKGEGYPKEQVFPLFKHVCAALTYAHERNLIHADLKPSNIFINEEGVAKVLDFGIARAASQEGQKHHFDVGTLGAHTPAYATVEVINGEPSAFTDDVYAMACILYEALAGEHPYNQLSAEEALEEKLSLKRIPSLNKREWAALSKALSLTRVERTGTINEFYQAMFPKSSSAKFKVSATILACALIGLGWFGYQQYQTEVQRSKAIAEKLDQAQQCYDSGNYNCALEQSLVANNLDPDNLSAKELYRLSGEAITEQQRQQKIQQLFTEVNRCFDEENYSCAQTKMADLLALDVNQKEAETLQKDIENAITYQRISGLLEQGETCLEENDIGCAESFLYKAQNLDPRDASVISLEKKISEIKASRQAARSARLEKVKALLKKAKSCESKRHHNCVLRETKKILAIDAKNPEAVSMRSSALLEKKIYNENKTKADKIVQQGIACFEKANYSCAIGKAEYALGIMPNHKSALALKKKSINTQNDLKTSLEIQ